MFSSKTLTVSLFTKENKWTSRKLSGKSREMRKGRGKGEGGRGGGFLAIDQHTICRSGWLVLCFINQHNL